MNTNRHCQKKEYRYQIVLVIVIKEIIAAVAIRSNGNRQISVCRYEACGDMTPEAD